MAQVKKRELRFDGTWDIETEDWDKFVMGGLLVGGQTHIVESERDFFRKLMELPKGTFWAHNGGRFDMLWLAEMLIKEGIDWTGALRGSSIIELTVGETSFRDSFAVFPEKLSIVAEAGGASKLEVGLPCKCDIRCTGYCARKGVECKCPKSCGGYCSIKRRMPSPLKARLAEYLEADCVGLDAGLKALATFAARNDIELRNTIGASAWNTCAKWIGLDTKRPAHTLSLYRDLRAGYYGGRTELYGFKASEGNRYDIHNSYPAALSAMGLPTGDIRSANADKAFANGYDGVYTARVRVPECHSPPLPIRTDDRLAYCFGEFSGTWTGVELRHALECGATILEIEEGIYCEQSEKVLAPYANRVWDIRQKAKKEEKDGIYRWVKWLANSLTGKLAMQPTVVTLACVDVDAGMKPGEMRILEKHGRLIVAREVDRVSSCAHVEWAAHLTSYARVELHRQLLEAGRDALYCDTDSVYTRGTLSRRVGDGLGEWGHEGSMTEWHGLAPKIYRYFDEAKAKYVVRGKGMSKLTAEGFDRLAEGEAWEVNEGVSTLKTAIQKGQGLFSRKSLSRKLAEPGPYVGSRRRAGNETCAVDFSEYVLAHE